MKAHRPTLMHGHPQRLLPVGLVLLIVACAGLLAVDVPSAHATLSFGASNSAHASRVQFNMSQAPLFPNLIDAGGPSALSTLDSLGTTRAVAALPYPGEAALGLPGLAAGLAPQVPALINQLPGTAAAYFPGGLPPEAWELISAVQVPPELTEPLVEQAPTLPAYPAAAIADSQTPDAEVNAGAATMTAHADPSLASAEVQTGPGEGPTGSSATASVTASEDLVVSEASTVNSGFAMEGLVIGSVRSTARMELSADGTVTRHTDFGVQGMEIQGTQVELAEDGSLVVADQVLPNPLAAPLQEVLAGAGFTVEVLPAEEFEGGVVAGGLKISRTFELSQDQLPADLPLGELGIGVPPLGTGEISVILGQASARLSGAPVPEFNPGSGVTAGTTGGGTTTDAPVSGGSVAPASTGSSAGSGPSTVSPASSPGAIAASSPGAATAGGGGTSPAPAPVAVGPALPLGAGATEPPFDVGYFYLVIVAAAIATSATRPLARRLPFRPRRATGSLSSTSS